MCGATGGESVCESARMDSQRCCLIVCVREYWVPYCALCVSLIDPVIAIQVRSCGVSYPVERVVVSVRSSGCECDGRVIRESERVT